MPKHDFGIMAQAPQAGKRFDKYEPEKYNCISVSDDDLQPCLDAFRCGKTYWHSLDRPELGVIRAWQESKRLMQGHKWQLFLVDFSFLPWYLVSILLSYGLAWLLSLAGLSLAAIWVSFAAGLVVSVFLNPYVELTVVGFYERLRGAGE